MRYSDFKIADEGVTSAIKGSRSYEDRPENYKNTVYPRLFDIATKYQKVAKSSMERIYTKNNLAKYSVSINDLINSIYINPQEIANGEIDDLAVDDGKLRNWFDSLIVRYTVDHLPEFLQTMVLIAIQVIIKRIRSELSSAIAKTDFKINDKKERNAIWIEYKPKEDK